MDQDLRQLFIAHRRELQAFLTMKLRDATLAADLTQETFLRFAEFRAGNPAAVIAHVRSYLYRTAYNLAIDHLRREGRTSFADNSEDALAAIPDDMPVPEAVVSGRNELDRIQALLRELPERTRHVVTLARLEGLTYPEVAERLGISTSSVQKHLAQATKYVMQRLREDTAG